jgi:hypothetical protein
VVFSIAGSRRAAARHAYAAATRATHRRLIRPRTRRRCSRRALPVALALLAACAAGPPLLTADLAYTRLAIDGSLALDGGAQDVGPAFGLGGERSSPHVRVAADLGMPELAVSGFWIHEQGNGVLTAPFGGLPAGTAVATDLDLGNAKVTAALAVELGPVTIAPGLLVDVFAVDFHASSSPGNREEVDEVVAVPLPFVHARAALGRVHVLAEVGWFELPSSLDTDGRFVDVEAGVAWNATGRVHLLAGWRHLAADVDGSSGSDAVGIDLSVQGWFVGGGIRF